MVGTQVAFEIPIASQSVICPGLILLVALVKLYRTKKKVTTEKLNKLSEFFTIHNAPLLFYRDSVMQIFTNHNYTQQNTP